MQKIDRNQVIEGNAIDLADGLESRSIATIFTSPPYWNKRDYDGPSQVWGGDPDCDHEWGEELEIHQSNRYTLSGSTLHGAPRATAKTIESVNREKSGGKICVHCGAWHGQLGLEPTFTMFVDNLCTVFDRMVPGMELWSTAMVNIADSYATRPKYDLEYKDGEFNRSYNVKDGYQNRQKELPDNCLCNIPHRFAIEMCNRGWILRSTIIWYKRSTIPDPHRDRFTDDFEYIFMFSRSNKPLYWVNRETLGITAKKPKGINGVEGTDWVWVECHYCQGYGISKEGLELLWVEELTPKERKGNLFEVAQLHPCQRCRDRGRLGQGTGRLKKNLWAGRNYHFEQMFENQRTLRADGSHVWSSSNPIVQVSGDGETGRSRGLHGMGGSPIGRNMRCVWDIPPTPSLKGVHTATFPVDLAMRPVKAGCPEKVCTKCGLPMERVYGKPLKLSTSTPEEKFKNCILTGFIEWDEKKPFSIFLGETNCGCGAEFEPGVVLDPFGGTGTVGIAAKRQKKDWLLFDINPEYVEMSKRRIEDDDWTERDPDEYSNALDF